MDVVSATARRNDRHAKFAGQLPNSSTHGSWISCSNAKRSNARRMKALEKPKNGSQKQPSHANKKSACPSPRRRDQEFHCKMKSQILNLVAVAVQTVH